MFCLIKRFSLFIFAFYCVSKCSAKFTDTVNDTDVTVPVYGVITSAVYNEDVDGYWVLYDIGENGNEIKGQFKIGRWQFITSYFDDVILALDAMPKTMDNLAQFLTKDTKDQDGWEIELSEKVVCFARAIAINEALINSALAQKYDALKTAAQNTDKSDEEDNVTNKKDEIDALVKKANDTVKKNCTKAINDANKKITKTANEARDEVSKLTDKIIENAKKMQKATNPDVINELKDIGNSIRDLQAQIVDIGGIARTAQSDAQLALQKCSNLFFPVIAPIPSEIMTYSNQMERLSKFIGYSGNEKNGRVQLPEIPDGFSFSEDGDSESGGDNSFPIYGGEGSGKQEFKTLLDYLYAAGFMPFLPPQLEGSVKLSGQQSSFGRFFYFEKKEDSGESEDGGEGSGGSEIILHAQNVPMPKEWSIELDVPWYYDKDNNEWKNAYVQIGNSLVRAIGGAVEGKNYAKVDIDKKQVTISETASSGGQQEGSSGEQENEQPNVVYFEMGEIVNGELKNAAHYVPIVFVYE